MIEAVGYQWFEKACWGLIDSLSENLMEAVQLPGQPASFFLQWTGRGWHPARGHHELVQVGLQSRLVWRGRVPGLYSSSLRSAAYIPHIQCLLSMLISSTTSFGVKTLCRVNTLHTSGLPGSVLFIRCVSVTICMTRWRVSSGVAASSI
jgi:hypothetical protein